MEIGLQGRAKREVKRLVLCLTHWVEASGQAFWPSKPHEHWCCRHHKANRFNFKKEIRDKALYANHPASGANTDLGKGAAEITCLSCHQPHHSKHANLVPPNFSTETALCESCHKDPWVHKDD